MAIKVTPEELEAMAEDLKKYAGQSTSLASSINRTVTAALNAWEGNAQKDFAERFNEIFPILNKNLPDLINEMARDAEQRAKRYREADA